MGNKNVFFFFFSPSKAVHTPLNPALDTTADLAVQGLLATGFQL